MNKKTFLILLIGLPLAFFAGLKCQKTISQMDEISNPTISLTRLSGNSKIQPLYFVKKQWGLTGDHQIIALTTREPQEDKWLPNEATDFVWKGSVTVYYQRKSDVLNVWASHLPDTTQKKLIGVQFIQIRGEMFDELKNQTDQAIKLLD